MSPAVVALAVLIGLGGLVACHDGPMAKIDRLRDALVSDDAEHVHGHMLMVDGGMSVWQQPGRM